MSNENKEVSVIIKALDQTVPGFKSARQGVSNFASEAKGLIAEAFAGFTIFEFFKTAIEHATDAEKSYVQLSNTLANVGVSYEKNRGEIDETIKSLQKVANVRTDEAIKGFNTLVQRSGDYSGALKNMNVVADLAKAKHLEFNDAAELVGRVMGGNTRVLKQFGIVTKDAHEGLALLAERLHGAAAADMATFGGQVEAVKNRFFDLAESFGDIITGSSKVGGGLASVGKGIEQLTTFLNENRGTIGVWLSRIITGVSEAGRVIGDLAVETIQTFSIVNKFLSLSWGNPGDKEKRQQLWAEIAEGQKIARAADNDIKGSPDRMIVAAANAEKAGAAIEEASAARLKANALRTTAEKQKTLDAAGAAQKKQLDAEEAARNAALDKQVASYGKAAQLRDFQDRAYREQAIAGLNLMESLARRELAGLDNSNASLARRLVLEERIAKITEEKKKAGITTARPLAALEGTPVSGAALVDSFLKAGEQSAEAFSQGLKAYFKQHPIRIVDAPSLGFIDAIVAALAKNNSGFRDAAGNIKGFGDELGDVVAGPLQQFGEATAMAMGAMIVGSKTAGAAFRQAMLSALGSVAKMEGDYMMARAIGGSAKGVGGNPLGFLEAAKWMIGAAAMYAVAGGASALASSGGSGGGGGAAGSPNATLSSSDQSQGAMTVVLNGTRMVIDASDPQSQDDFTAMLKKLAGNRQIDFVVNANG